MENLRGIRSASMKSALALAFCAWPGWAIATTHLHADELAQLSLGDLLHVEVLGASRYSQPLAETPASVTVIGEEELRRQSY